LKALKQLHYPNNRQALAAVIACAVLLAVLVVMWLAVATNTALLNQQLDQNDANQRHLTEEENQLWRQIGDVTSPAQMKARMQQAGFGTPASTLYLFIPTATAVISPTVTGASSAPSGGGGGGK
jgi:hypothetical protein